MFTKHIPCMHGLKLHLNCDEQTHSISARTPNLSQHVLTKRILCQLYSKFISARDDKTYSMPASTQNVSQLVLTKLHPLTSRSKNIDKIKWTYTIFDQTNPLRTSSQNSSEHVMTKPHSCQRIHRKYLNMHWSNPSHISKDIFDRAPKMHIEMLN